MKTLFIISGGPGKEHEVSLLSGDYIMEELIHANIPYKKIIIEKDKKWICEDVEMSEDEGVLFLKKSDALVLQVIHGTYGEDGTLALLLEKNNIPYIGSSSSALILTIDKFKTESLLQNNAISTPKTLILKDIQELVSLELTPPYIVKPNTEGSSISLYKVIDKDELLPIVEKMLVDHRSILVQEYISGREFTCGVVEINGVLTALSPTEIILTQGDMFDYTAKYTINGCKEVTPALVDEETTVRIQELAKKVHELCECKDISRTDMIMKDTGEIVVLEINTIPGMTKTSFIPAGLRASGYDIPTFVKGMMDKYSQSSFKEVI